MNRRKESSSQAAWALITDGVVSSRIEAHRLRHLVNRGLKLVDQSEEKEHIYQVAGDLILAVPKRLDLLEGLLDRTSYALTIMGKDFLRSRLPIHDRNMVDEAIESSPSFSGMRSKQSMLVQRVAQRWTKQAGASQKDLLDALDHASDEIYPDKYHLSDFELKDLGNFKISNIPDDLSSWVYFSPGELKGLSRDELMDELGAFRGRSWATRAMVWANKGKVPPIVLVETPEFQGVGDGRGRLNLAVGLGWDRVPAVLLRKK